MSHYWVYRTHVNTWRGQPVQAMLVTPSLDELKQIHGLSSPMQDRPYDAEVQWTFRINPAHPYPDNYGDNTGFTLYSQRLVRVMRSFEVKAEYFPATLVDVQGHPQTHLDYSVFHSLEGVQPAMDEAQSGWTGDYRVGISRLVLDYSKFEHRPLFICNHIYVPLIRDDVKQAIQQQGISGFDFCRLERYTTGNYGMVLDFDES